MFDHILTASSMYVYLSRDQDKKEREALLEGIIISIESHIAPFSLLFSFPYPTPFAQFLRDIFRLFSV